MPVSIRMKGINQLSFSSKLAEISQLLLSIFRSSAKYITANNVLKKLSGSNFE